MIHIHEKNELSDSEFKSLQRKGKVAKETKWKCTYCNITITSGNPFPKTCISCGSTMSFLGENE